MFLSWNVSCDLLKKYEFSTFFFRIDSLIVLVTVSLQILIDMKMDVRDMSYFPDDSFDSVIDKGMLALHSMISC